jgi:hypothetical protein
LSRPLKETHPYVAVQYVRRFWQDPYHAEISARLSIVTLGVRNMTVLRSFYRALGWRSCLASKTTTWCLIFMPTVLQPSARHGL